MIFMWIILLKMREWYEFLISASRQSHISILWRLESSAHGNRRSISSLHTSNSVNIVQSQNRFDVYQVLLANLSYLLPNRICLRCVFRQIPQCLIHLHIFIIVEIDISSFIFRFLDIDNIFSLKHAVTVDWNRDISLILVRSQQMLHLFSLLVHKNASIVDILL